MRSLIVLLFATVSLLGQDPALTRLKHEMAVARAQVERAMLEKRPARDGGVRIEAIHAALRNWMEMRLPKDSYALLGEFPRVQASLSKDLMDAGLSAADSSGTDGFDSLFRRVGLLLTMMPELPDTLFVTASLDVGCGRDQAVYAYHFDANGPKRVIEDHPKSDFGYGNAGFELSEPDSQGRRLFLIHRSNIQCGSSWKDLTYAVYRMSLSQPPKPLLSSKHDFWLGNDGPYFVLRPDELTIEFLDRSIDMGVHNRTHIFRYNFANGVRRLEPFAFQPQDFVEEWLTTPSSEVQSMSTSEAGEWRRKLHNVSYDQYFEVVACIAKPGRWSIGLQVTYEGEKELEMPIQTYFLVEDVGNYRYTLEAVSDEEFEGCPGEGSPSDKHPWLSVEQLKALP